MYLLVFIISLALGSNAFVNYEGYQVYQVTPKNLYQVQLLEFLKTDRNVDFWTDSHVLFRPVDVMVKPDMVDGLRSILTLNGFDYKIMIDNVGKIVNRQGSGLTRSGQISFTQYNRYDTITAYLKSLAKNNPSTVSFFNIGKSSENRDILGVKLSSGDGINKPAILVDGGIHAREWMSPATVLYIINQLAENQTNANMLRNVDWYIIPVLNPDGYEYTHVEDRFWRKTRSSGKYCDGVDANRNFGFHWNEVGASDDECDETYAGPQPFSEPETQNLKNFALKLKNVQLYLTFHSYGQYLLYPWGFTTAYPDNRIELQLLAEKVNAAISGVRGTEYEIGSSTNVLYPAAGGSDDWMMGVAGVPVTYTIELPGRNGGFAPSAKEIKGVVQETFEGVKVYHKFVEDKYL